jgi:hypothetical protein
MEFSSCWEPLLPLFFISRISSRSLFAYGRVGSAFFQGLSSVYAGLCGHFHATLCLF